ncbi:MAG: hypothetical protein U0271_33940 [Polyangiaceae bacterium]
MQFKVSSFDMKLSRAQRISAALIGAFLGVAVCAKLATAQVPNTFTAGQTLTAADLNENFNALDGKDSQLDTRVSQLEAAPAPTAITVAGSVGEAGPGANIPTVYTHADLVLPPGTWLVQGYAGLSISVNNDGVGLGLYNVTADADVPNSVGPIMVMRTTDPLDALSTAQTLITVSTTTTLRLKAIQNGTSIPSFSDFSGTATLAALGPHKLTAVKLH